MRSHDIVVLRDKGWRTQMVHAVKRTGYLGWDVSSTNPFRVTYLLDSDALIDSFVEYLLLPRRE
jgi:hypothetical protein